VPTRTRSGSRRDRDEQRGPGRGGPSGRSPARCAKPAAGTGRRPVEAEGALGGARVLLVEDEPAIRALCRINLNLAGIETLEAADGEEALELVRAERPDLVLLDVMLPRIDGWEVATRLREDDATREIPVVFLSARTDRGDRARGDELGGVGYVAKPFDPAALAAFVRETLVRIARGERDDLRAERFRDVRSGTD